MTENNLKEDFLIDKIADKVSKSKWARGLFAGTTLLSGTWLTAACTTSPPAEVAPAATEEKVFKAEFSGIITREKVAEMSGETKVILDQELDSIEAKYSSIPGYVKETEMSYWISTSDDKVMAYHLVGILNDNNEVGVQILEFSNLKTNQSQEINSPLVRLDSPDGGSYFGWVDEKGGSHLIASYYSDGETHLIDPDENVYVESKSSFEELVEGVVSIGAMSVQAAPEATVEPTATLPIVETATPEPTATATEAPTATKEASAIPEGFQVFTEITGLDGKVYDVTTVEGLKALNESNLKILYNDPAQYWLQNKPGTVKIGNWVLLNVSGVSLSSSSPNVHHVSNVTGEVLGVINDPNVEGRMLYVVDTGVSGYIPVRIMDYGDPAAALHFKIENGGAIEGAKGYFKDMYPDVRSFLTEINNLDEDKKKVTFVTAVGEKDSTTETFVAEWVMVQATP